MGTVLKEKTYALKKVHIPVLEEHLKKEQFSTCQVHIPGS